MADAPEQIYPSESHVLAKPQFSASPELKVRTMASDLVSIASGSVIVPRGEVMSGAAVAAISLPRRNFFRIHSRAILMILIGAGIAIVASVIWFIAYYAVRPIFEKVPISVSEAPVPLSEAPASEPIPEAPAPFSHSSFFVSVPDRVQEFLFSVKPASTAQEIESFQEKFARALKGMDEGEFIEVAFYTDEGLSYKITDFFGSAGLGIISRTTLSDAFEADFTGFAVRDERGIWPGYVLRLREGSTKSAVQGNVSRLESSPLISGFFLGDPVVGKGFTDGVIGGRAVRIGTFSRPFHVFVYGWSNDTYLILSASEEGMKRALELLR